MASLVTRRCSSFIWWTARSWREISIDRMTEENDTSAPIEAICVMLCDKLIAEENMDCADVGGGFVWVEGARARDVLPSNKDALAHLGDKTKPACRSGLCKETMDIR